MTMFASLLRSLLMLGGCALTSCAVNTPQTRIAKNPDLYESLTPAQREVVGRGRVEKGLPKGGVFLAWGRPDRVAEWDRSGQQVERWTYLGVRPVHTYSLGGVWGPGWGGYGPGGPYGDPYFYGGPVVEWVPYPVSRVDFANERVTDWEVRLTRP